MIDGAYHAPPFLTTFDPAAVASGLMDHLRPDDLVQRRDTPPQVSTIIVIL